MANKYELQDLENAIDAVMTKNGYVTSLDVKNELREKDFYAVQEDVSSDLADVVKLKNYVVDYETKDGNTFKVFKNAPIVNDDDDDQDDSSPKIYDDLDGAVDALLGDDA